jgi:hypothetical protein
LRTSIFGKLTALSLVFLLSACSSTPDVYDVLILDGTIIDGSGAPAYAGDIAIIDNEIVKIGELNGSKATRVIDANGLTVVPGFIDLHTHADRNIRDNPGVENYLRQGVTTILAGNCGNSPVDLDTVDGICRGCVRTITPFYFQFTDIRIFNILRVKLIAKFRPGCKQEFIEYSSAVGYLTGTDKPPLCAGFVIGEPVNDCPVALKHLE